MSDPIPPTPVAAGSRSGRPPWIVPAILIAIIVVIAVLFVTSSLRRPELAEFGPSPALAGEAGEGLVGPLTYTIDATDGAAWRHFDFSSGSRVEPADPLGWDIAFRRFHVIANGGERFPGKAGVLDLGEVGFDSVLAAPATGYIETRSARDTLNPAIDRWYTYSWISHILKTSDHVYAVRTADGRYAKMRILSYYCPGAVPGCMTFEYVYQGSGSRSFVPEPNPVAGDPDPR